MQTSLQGVLWIIPFIPGSQVTPEEKLKPSTGKADERNINLNENSGADRNKQGEMQEAILSTLYSVVDLPLNTGPSAEMQPNTGHSTQKAYPWQVILV